MKQWFNKGYTAVKEHSADLEQRQKEAQERSQFIPTVMLKDGESALVRFLTSEPITFMEHYLKDAKGRKYFTCLEGSIDEKTGEPVECPFCSSGNKPSFKGAYLVFDRREDIWVDKQKVEHREQNQVKTFKQGIKALKVLDKLSSKRDVLLMDVEITRTGEKTDTQYNFIPEEKTPRTKEEGEKIEKFLGDKTYEDKLVAEFSPLSYDKAMAVLTGRPVFSSEQEAPETTTRKPDAEMHNFDENDTLSFK